MTENKLKRQERFIQQSRFKAKAKKNSYFTWGPTNPVSLGILYHTPKRCSCPSCGNPRKHFNEKTIHETSFDELFQLELHFLNNCE